MCLYTYIILIITDHELHALADQDRKVEVRDHARRGADLDERA